MSERGPYKPKRIIHLSDTGTRMAAPLCSVSAPGDPVWNLSKTRPPRAYVGNTLYTVLVSSLGSLAEGGVDLHACSPCVQKVQAISERLKKEHSQ